MTEVPGTVRGKVRPLTYVALGVSIFTSAATWFVLIGVGSPGGYDATIGLLPDFVNEYAGLFILILPVGLLAGIVLDILASTRGGRNLLICMFAGLVLISPAIDFAIPFIRGVIR